MVTVINQILALSICTFSGLCKLDKAVAFPPLASRLHLSMAAVLAQWEKSKGMEGGRMKRWGVEPWEHWAIAATLASLIWC